MAGSLSESLKYIYFAHFLPEKRKEAPFVVVDKRRFFYGAHCRTRTYDPAVNSRMLYRLS